MNEETLISIKAEISSACCRCEFLIEIIEGMKAEDDKNRNYQTKKAYRR